MDHNALQASGCDELLLDTGEDVKKSKGSVASLNTDDHKKKADERTVVRDECHVCARVYFYRHRATTKSQHSAHEHEQFLKLHL